MDTNRKSLDDIFPTNWMKADVDFAEGEEKTFTIKSWSETKFKRDGKDEAAVDIAVEENKKQIGLNKMNREAIAKLCGSRFPDDWIGKRVTFFTVWTQNRNGETVRGIRVKPTSEKVLTHDEIVAQLKDLRDQIRAMDATKVPAKESLKLETYAEQIAEIARHKKILSELREAAL